MGFIIFNFYFLGIDHLLAQHIAHLFIRDPISLFREKIHQNDDLDIDHFEVKLYRVLKVVKLIIIKPNSKCFLEYSINQLAVDEV